MTKVSVIIPVYNTARRLGKCISSVLRQTLADIEIILIDDGSTDESLKVIQEYAGKDARVKYETQANQGPSAARNRGINLAIGKYLAFVDSDDWIEPDMYQTMYDAAERYSLNMVLCGLIHDYTDRPSCLVNFSLPVDKILDKVAIKKYILPVLLKDSVHSSACNKLFRREFINSLHSEMPIGLNYGEDLLFLLTVFDQLTKTYFINIPFYHYVHQGLAGLTTKRHADYNRILQFMYNARKGYARKWGFTLAEVAEPYLYCSLMELVQNVAAENVRRKKREILTDYLNSPDIQEAMAAVAVTTFKHTVKLRILLLFLKLRCMSIITLLV